MLSGPCITHGDPDVHHEKIDEKKIRSRLLEEYNLEIGAGLGPFAGNVWRIGLMGYSARKENIELCLGALKACI